jgi:hypothetical protein
MEGYMEVTRGDFGRLSCSLRARGGSSGTGQLERPFQISFWIPFPARMTTRSPVQPPELVWKIGFSWSRAVKERQVPSQRMERGRVGLGIVASMGLTVAARMFDWKDP